MHVSATSAAPAAVTKRETAGPVKASRKMAASKANNIVFYFPAGFSQFETTGDRLMTVKSTSLSLRPYGKRDANGHQRQVHLNRADCGLGLRPELRCSC